MQWLRCSEDGTCQRGALPGVALGALAVEAMVLQLVLGLLELVCVESDYGQVYLLEGQVVLDTELLQVVVEGHLALDSAWPHQPRPYLATGTTCDCHLASPAVQCSKSGRVTNAKAKIQI